ncbi:hypothetical protein DFH09DRAFT_1251126 [Mycena vulgaris]|nr:hypothetical protein DFH09DRAFT_1251126 [Mycena vulgaris]
MLSSNLLHQIIKGSFKDHLVTWVGEYLYIEHSKAQADAIMDEIDCQYTRKWIAAVPAFPCLCRFKQWTEDDSKALTLIVYLPAIKGLVPPEIVEAISAFLDFCYLVRHADFEESTLDTVDKAVKKCHVLREVFRTLGVCPNGFSLPCQHSMVHYRVNIEDVGAPGEVCSSITESRHITAVKKPWRHSSRYELDKLAAARANFVERGMIPPVFVPVPDKDPKDTDKGGPIDEPRVEGNVVLAHRRDDLAIHIKVPIFPELLASFLNDHLHSDSYSSDDDSSSAGGINISRHQISVFHLAVATFFAPSDPLGTYGMCRERIQSTPTWRKHGPRQDCAFAVKNQQEHGIWGMSAVQVLLLFSFSHNGVDYLCTLVEWFKKVGQSPNIETELTHPGGSRLTTIVHLDTLLRGAHLIPVYGTGHIHIGFHHIYSLNALKSFHVNKYVDHHANEIAF